MKKSYITILLVVLSYSLHSQTDPNLFGQWFLHYTEINGTRTYVPEIRSNADIDINFNNDANPGLPSGEGDSTCNSFTFNYEVNNTLTSVNILFTSQTLAACNGDTFEPTYLSILNNATTNFFDYTIDLQEESLTMIDLLGVKLVYGRQVLSTNDFNVESETLKLFMNLSKNELSISGITTDLTTTYSIHEMSGKALILNHQLKNNTVSINNLRSGVYFLKVVTKRKTYIKKFIKA